MTIDNLIGIIIYKLTGKINTSTGIDDGLTFGYGKLDNNGYWQFPVYNIKQK